MVGIVIKNEQEKRSKAQQRRVVQQEDEQEPNSCLHVYNDHKEVKYSFVCSCIEYVAHNRHKIWIYKYRCRSLLFWFYNVDYYLAFICYKLATHMIKMTVEYDSNICDSDIMNDDKFLAIKSYLFEN